MNSRMIALAYLLMPFAHIGTDSTGAAGKLPRYLLHYRSRSIILARYYFALATILTLLSYTKIVKIDAIRIIFSPDIHQRASLDA